MKKSISLFMCVLIVFSLLTVCVSAEDQLELKRAVVINKTQIVLEFSEPVEINLLDSNRGPYMALRVLDNNEWLAYNGATPLQFDGSYDFVDDKHDRIIWTLKRGVPYDNPSVESILNYEGDMARWSKFAVKFYIEEVPFNESAVDAGIDNITNGNGSVQLTSTVGGTKARWAGISKELEIDYDYTLRENEEKEVMPNIFIKDSADYLVGEAPAEKLINTGFWLGIAIGAAVVLVIVYVISVVKKSGKKMEGNK